MGVSSFSYQKRSCPALLAIANSLPIPIQTTTSSIRLSVQCKEFIRQGLCAINARYTAIRQTATCLPENIVAYLFSPPKRSWRITEAKYSFHFNAQTQDEATLQSSHRVPRYAPPA